MSSQFHPLGYESKTAKLSSGHHLRYVDIHPPQGVTYIATALLIHGFPDSAYGWRHQVKGWSQRGIRLIVPDTIGYTGSSQPTDPREGAVTASRVAQFKPDLVKGAVNLGIPFAPPSPQYVPLETLVQIFPSFGYQLYLASPRSNEPMDANVEKFVNALYSSPAKFASGELPPFEKIGVLEGWLQDQSQVTKSDILTEEEMDTILSEIKSGVGFSAMLNYYRTNQINHELEKNLPQEFRPDMPKLLVLPTADPALPAEILAQAGQGTKETHIAWLEGAGHWVMLERPQEVERLVGEWVERMAAKDWAV
ncbi:Alpha/Beta hydrolase protein [Rhizoctonia solani]|nr:Alpha/Beta hydrolase protein [Rhizoctonia solani]